jgi:hypothetical protein
MIPFCEMQVNQAHMRDLALSDGTNFTEVRGDNKVAFCDIRPATSFADVPGDLGGSYHEYKGLLVMHITSHSPHSGAFPVYFLPWDTDEMYRMKLKPSPHHAKRTERWFLGMLGGDTIVPNIFVTAAVQGCSVFVRGDPESPVVYHVNASGSNPVSGATLASADSRQFLEAAQHKATVMTQRTALAQQERPKEGPKLPTGMRGAPGRSLSGEAHLTDYMPGMLPAFQDRSKQNYARILNVPATDVEVQQFGTIFGFRQDRDWVFYRQTRTALSYRRNGVWTDEFRDPVCLKFWPPTA